MAPAAHCAHCAQCLDNRPMTGAVTTNQEPAGRAHGEERQAIWVTSHQDHWLLGPSSAVLLLLQLLLLLWWCRLVRWWRVLLLVCVQTITMTAVRVSPWSRLLWCRGHGDIVTLECPGSLDQWRHSGSGGGSGGTPGHWCGPHQDQDPGPAEYDQYHGTDHVNLCLYTTHCLLALT